VRDDAGGKVVGARELNRSYNEAVIPDRNGAVDASSTVIVLRPILDVTLMSPNSCGFSSEQR